MILAADVLGSYGSLAKFRNLPRIHQVNKQTVLALGGDLSDAAYIKEAIDTKVYVFNILNIETRFELFLFWLAMKIWSRKMVVK